METNIKFNYPSSEKVYLSGKLYPEIKVGMRQGRRITFLYDNQRYFLEKYYLYSQKKHEYLDYIEQYPRSAS